jgi:hypothetical protein
MSYEIWQKIWQQQVAPRLATSVEPQELLARVKADSDQFEHEWRKEELRRVGSTGLALAVFLLGGFLLSGEGGGWGIGVWLLIVMGMLNCGAGVIAHEWLGRSSLKTGHDPILAALLSAMTRCRLRLRLYRIRFWGQLSVFGALGLGFCVIRLVSLGFSSAGIALLGVMVGVSTALAASLWLGNGQYRKRCEELRARLVELEELRVELDATDETSLPLAR